MCTPEQRQRAIDAAVTEMCACVGPQDEAGATLYARGYGCVVTGVPARDVVTLRGHLGRMGDEPLALLLELEGFAAEARVLRGDTPPRTTTTPPPAPARTTPRTATPRPQTPPAGGCVVA